MTYVFPAALMANTFAFTGMMIVLGFAGDTVMAADFGIVHGATVALLYSFSANARSILLNAGSPISVGGILCSRLLLLLPLGLLSLWLSTRLGSVGTALALALTTRRCAEWIAEVHISKLESVRETHPAKVFLALQGTLFLLTAAWLVAGLPFALPVLFIWSTSPVWLSVSFVARHVTVRAMIAGDWLQLLPHFGSTAIIGISVYVFRLLILLLVGKAVAGDLYTAFAIGGLLGSVFAQAIGPTLMLQQTRGMMHGLPVWIRIVLVASAVAGLGLYATAGANPQWLGLAGKSTLFWQAVGLSLVGGAIMVIAQILRLRILQQKANSDVFGPDVVANILIVAAVPYVFYLLGSSALGYLYLISAIMALMFYFSADPNIWTRIKPVDSGVTSARSAIAFLLLLPLFFQLSGTIFRETTYLFDSEGNLLLLPIPVSVLACYFGILLLGQYSRARLALTLIFATFASMLVTSVLLSHVQAGQEQAKLVLLIQFVLPMFALVLGQLHGEHHADHPILATGFLWVLVILVPIQLLSTWLDQSLILSPSFGLFSAYQHLQYVPMMFVSAYLLALYALWEKPRCRMLLLGLSAPIGLYAGASVSALATAGLVAGVTGFAVLSLRRRGHRIPLLSLVTVILVCSIGYFSVASGRMGPRYDVIRLHTDTALFAPKNLAQRITYWKFYAGEILSSPKSAALGHVTPPDRSKYPSAHNYYLDFAYNFGVLPLLPMLGLIGLTLAGVRRKWREIKTSMPLLGLTTIVLFLVLVDNSFKVGMRQPYPGILTFFLWGVLLSHLFAPSITARTETTA